VRSSPARLPTGRPALHGAWRLGCATAAPSRFGERGWEHM
jgi:hypothetical protein